MILVIICASVWQSRRVHMNVYSCMRMSACMCECHVHGDVSVRVWSLHDSQCHNRAQKRLDILTGNHSRRSCVFPATYNPTLSQRVTWLDPHIGSERGSPSSILSSIQISAPRFTWSRSYRPAPVWATSVAKQQQKNWLRLETACYRGSNVWSVDIQPQQINDKHYR